MTKGCPVRPIPVPAGVIRQVTPELAQTGFPVAARTALGTAVVAYGHGPGGHVSVDGQARVRRQPVGAQAWSEPIVALDEPGEYSMVSAGLAAEPESHGDRLYMLVSRAKAASVTTSADYSTRLCYSDDDGLTWTTPVPLPAPVGQSVVASGLTWIPDDDGTLIATAYLHGGAPTGRVYASTDRGATWEIRAEVTVPGSTQTAANRACAEPTTVRLLDGRLLMAIRSDGAPIGGTNPVKYYYSYIYTCVSADAGRTWTVPKATVAHASGLPAMHVTPSGHVAVMFRGQSEPGSTPVGYYPMRVTMVDPDGFTAYDGQRDLVFGDRRRFLYGSFLPAWGDDPVRVLWGAENTVQSNPAGTASIYELPLIWVDQPA